MTGDNADNIKGADKVGPKTAATLLGMFGTLEDIISNANQIAKPSIRDSVIRNAERLKTNQRIIKLDDRAEIPFSLEELSYSYDGKTTNEVLVGIRLK